MWASMVLSITLGTPKRAAPLDVLPWQILPLSLRVTEFVPVLYVKVSKIWGAGPNWSHEDFLHHHCATMQSYSFSVMPCECI